MVGQLSGRAGLGVTDSVSLRHWLLRFGAASGAVSDCCRLRGLFKKRAGPIGRLPIYDEHPSDRNRQSARGQASQVGGTCRRLMAKCLLQVTGQEAKAALGTEQLSGGVKAWIQGGIHDMRLLWSHHSQEEDFGFLPIDARKDLNEENRTPMLWAV